MGRERLARYSLTGPENHAAVEAGIRTYPTKVIDGTIYIDVD